MEKEKLARINALAKKSKESGLTKEERQEQASLREAYLAEFRASFGGMLENTYIAQPDGKKVKLQKKPDGAKHS